MFRKRKSKKNVMEHGDARGPTPNGHGVSELDEEQGDREFTEEQGDREFTEELDKLLDEETGEIPEEDQAFKVEWHAEAHPATEDDPADKVNTIWRQRLEHDPEGALGDLRARINELGCELAYAGRTHRAPVTKRTYYILDPDKRERLDVFHDGVGDLTLLDVCLWSELAFKEWKNS